jgi:signal transduction histidine kinase
VALGLEVCRKQVMRDPQSVADRLLELQETVDVSRAELRRFIYDLRPAKLQELGLVGAVEYWVREVTSDRPLKAAVVVEGERRTLTPVAEACLYRVAKESMSNVVKHADARHATVTVAFETDGVRLTIEDDGCGFERDRARDISDFGQGIGLRSIEERVKREHGELQITSNVDTGTRIEVWLPA